MRIMRQAVFVALLVLLGWSATSRAAALSGTEEQVLAVMVYNLAKLVEWPAQELPGDGTPLTICVIGKGAVANAMDLLQGKVVNGHPITIRYVKEMDAIGAPQVLVVAPSEQAQLSYVLDSLDILGRSVLTVSTIPGFAEAGGMVGLVRNGGSYRMELNLTAARQAQLSVPPSLLALAKIVRQ